jgi:hypothetical protein
LLHDRNQPLTSEFGLKIVKEVQFHPSKEQMDIILSGDVGKLNQLKAIWQQRRPFLPVKGSDAGWVGAHYVKLLLASGSEDDAQQALAASDVMLKEDWQPTGRLESRGLRIASLAKAGRMNEAVEELAFLDKDQQRDASIVESKELAEMRSRVSFIRADLAWAQLQALENEWPKWHLMPEIRDKRRQLINDAIDHSLEPAAFHATLQKQCAEGLWKAIQVYLHTDKKDQALLRAEALVYYFPDPDYVPRAENLIRKLKTGPESNPTSKNN